ncbi:hypothetical protein Afil01_09710 [Actinorhabdospora filicis]|uniref:Peptidoglycan binding-like domain-containing protein n=1 Tax=Actinorhabdospora filicis TaxID=1785913 RepID=A0A9W6SIK6_9ACTN|nr:peptidoglycan-binding domain-containing protein [Actinorhabdospora filicis]GLZ76164.1 hypothetical protein Afil01_09710 [Actinorhabdospora filicis]
MRIELRVAAVTAALLCALATTAVAAGPAAAAMPECVYQGSHRPGTGGGAVWVPQAANGSRHCWLRRGSKNSAVRALQQALKYCYSRDIVIDGSFGPKTEKALRNAQYQAGAVIDGEYGEESARLLKMASTTSTAWYDCAWQTF